MIRRVLALAAIVFVALLLESTVLAPLRVGGVGPDLLVVAVVAVGMASGAVSGALFGFWAGLLTDLLLDLPVGVSALVYTVVGYTVGTLRAYMVSGSALLPALLAAAASVASVLLSGLILRLLDLNGFTWGYLTRAAALAAVLNLLVAPLVYPRVRSLAERMVAERVIRW
jgi:rod shape-determining protein MreD